MRNVMKLHRAVAIVPAALAALFALAQAAPVRASDAVPGAPQTRPIALVGGKVHPVSSADIEEGTVLFENGKITAVGGDVKLPEGAERIDVKGKHVYPGLFDADTELGLVEIQAVRATVDYSETGSINPNVRAQAAFNPDSELIPVTRSGGVLTAVSAPLGGLIAGRGAVMRMDGWTWEQMTLRGEVMMYVNWPSMAETYTWRLDDPVSVEKSRASTIDKLTTVFADARAYRTLRRARMEQKAAPPDFDARWEAMIPVLDGKTPLAVRADDVRQIQSAVAFAKKEGLKLVIIGGYDAPACAELLKRENVPVIVKGVNRLPRYRNDAYDAAYSVPARLHASGVKFCISANDRMANTRNLPHHAAQAAAFGLPLDAALKSITLAPAEILGVADRLGSLEKGKAATIIVADGDILEIASSVTAAFIDGRKVDLTDRHKQLYAKYKQKYEQLKAAEKAD
jgi:imidazolonepropionase-like amidohydrolase